MGETLATVTQDDEWSCIRSEMTKETTLYRTETNSSRFSVNLKFTSLGGHITTKDKPMGECNTILSAYTLYRHLG